MISVVVADDQAVVRDGLILLLSASEEITVVGAAADGPEAVALIERTQPQVAPTPTVTSADPEAPSPDLVEGLTRREVDVVRLVAEGLSNRQIARRLVVSEATVKTHLNHVLSKLDVDGRPGLVAWAWRNGLAGQ